MEIEGNLLFFEGIEGEKKYILFVGNESGGNKYFVGISDSLKSIFQSRCRYRYEMYCRG